MHTLSAFYGSVASGAVDAVLPAINDQFAQVRNNRYQFNQPRQILCGFAGITDGISLKLDYPSALKVCTPIIDPLDADGLGGNLPAIVYYGSRGLVLPKAEDIGCLATRAVVAAIDCAVFLWHTQNFVPAVQGTTWTIRGVSNSTGPLGAWQLGTITLDRPLPAGRYAIVGMRVTGANVIAARLVFPGGGDRPGTLANVATTAQVFPFFRNGFIGEMGTFDNYLLPQIECIGNGAIAAQAVSLDIVPLTLAA